MASDAAPSLLALEGPDGSRVEATPHGAQALSWQCRGEERLYLSPNAAFGPDQAIRGGVPVIFPQFSDRGGGTRHGFARTRPWQPIANADSGRLAFALEHDDATLSLWPYRFRCELNLVADTDCLLIELTVHNLGDRAFEFTAALHTYLRVCDLSRVLLLGLEDAPYRIAGESGPMRDADDTPLRFDTGIDRIYTAPSRPLWLTDGDSAVRVQALNFPDIVVWNPGAEGGALLRDLEADGYRRFVCIEAAAVETPIRLETGQSWCGGQRLTLES